MTNDEMKTVRCRGGRPRVEGPFKRDIVVSTKLSKTEYDVLEGKINASRLTLYEYLRRALNEARISQHTYSTMKANLAFLRRSSFARMIIIESRVSGLMTAEQTEMIGKMTDGMNRLYKELNAIGRNLNEVARKANAGFARDYTSDLRKFGDEVLSKCMEYSHLKG